MCKHTIDLTRQTEVRELTKKTIPIKEQEEIIRNFNKLVGDINNRLDLEKTKFESPQKENMYRIEIVMLIGAMDYYCLEILKTGIIQIYNKERNSTDKYENLSIPMKFVAQALGNEESTEWLYSSIMSIYGKMAFQNVDKIHEVIITISQKEKWNETATKLNIAKSELQKKITKLCLRRHQIVHKCDIPNDSTTKQSITYNEVEKQTKFISKFINELHKLLII